MTSRNNCIGVLMTLCTTSIILWLYVFSDSVTSFSVIGPQWVNKSTFPGGHLVQHLSKLLLVGNTPNTSTPNIHYDDTRIRRPNTYIDQPSNFDVGRTIIAGVNSTGNNVHTVLFYKPVPWFWGNRGDSMFHHCNYSNCVATKDNSFLRTASAIVFHFYYFGMSVQTPPISPHDRNPDQAWVFMGRESPVHLGDSFLSKSWNNALNWSMTYRLTSDLYAGYGRLTRRTVLPIKDYDAIYRSKTKMAAWIVSNCHTEGKRDVFVADLKKYGVDVDVFGKCGKGRFPKGTNLTELLGQYKFYLALENSFCKDYVTEKFFGRYNLDLLLVARGGADYNGMMPVGAFINTGNFNGTQHLARHLLALAEDRDTYVEMLRRKDVYEAEDEGFGWASGLCELCEKLNNLEQNRKTYSDVYGYLHNDQCWKPPDIVTKPVPKPDIVKHVPK